MNALHPSETAFDGKVIEQSRHIKETDHKDRIIQCAQCGMYVDLDRRATGDSMGAIPDPTSTTQTIVPPSPGISQSDTFSDPVDTNTGCPFCNTMNPQGKFRDKLWGTSRSVENL